MGERLPFEPVFPARRRRNGCPTTGRVWGLSSPDGSATSEPKGRVPSVAPARWPGEAPSRVANIKN
jgi:hypothetical protein